MYAEYDTAPLNGSLKHATINAAAGFLYCSIVGAWVMVTLLLEVTSVMQWPCWLASLIILPRFTTISPSDGSLPWHDKTLRSDSTTLAPSPIGQNYPLARTSQPLQPDPSLPLFPEPNQPTLLAGHVNVAHAIDLVTRCSITGLVFMFVGDS